jgi:hypothetical protein
MSCVYFISDSAGSVKIGKSDNVLKRLTELQTASSETLKLVGTIKCLDSQNAHSVEKLIHNLLLEQHKRGEWFTLTEIRIDEIISTFKNVKLTFETKVKTTTLPVHVKVSKNLLDEVMAMTKAEQLVITTIKDVYEYDNQNNEVYLPLSRILTKSNCVVFRKGYKLLKDKNIVRRTKQSHYMINPNAYIPLDYQKAKKLWEESEHT